MWTLRGFPVQWEPLHWMAGARLIHAKALISLYSYSMDDDVDINHQGGHVPGAGQAGLHGDVRFQNRSGLE
jgi:hypothetical protein